jgi:hypothetical protein
MPENPVEFDKIQLLRLNTNKDLPMTNYTATPIQFPAIAFKRRHIQAQFSGGAITSDGGVLLLRTIDQRLQFAERVAALTPDRSDVDTLNRTYSLNYQKD